MTERVPRSGKTRRINAIDCQSDLEILFEYSRFECECREGKLTKKRRAISYFRLDEDRSLALEKRLASRFLFLSRAEHDVFICESPSFEHCAPPKRDLSSSRCFVSSREPVCIRFLRERKYAASANRTRLIYARLRSQDRLSSDIEADAAIQSRVGSGKARI